MKFEFAKYTDVTEFAKKTNSDYSTYDKILLCRDTWDTWIARIQTGWNAEYEEEEGAVLLERDKIPHKFKGQDLSLARAKSILKDDCFENWDVYQYESIDKAIEELDGGFGIN